MSKFEHFIVSRFNVKFHWRTGQPTNCTVPSRKWLVNRLKVFETYTYPSICNQTNQDFKWLIFFDGEATDRDLLKKFDRITPIFMYDYDMCKHVHVSKEIKAHISPDAGWIISSTLDVDDMYHPDMVQETQNLFTKEEKVIDFQEGVFYNTKKKYATRYRYRSPSPYLIVMEPLREGCLKTCKLVHHPGMFERFDKVQRVILNRPYRPMWATIIHGKNTVLEMRGTQRVNKKILSEFGL